MHHKKCKNGGFRAFSLKQNVVIVRCENKNTAAVNKSGSPHRTQATGGCFFFACNNVY